MKKDKFNPTLQKVTYYHVFNSKGNYLENAGSMKFIKETKVVFSLSEAHFQKERLEANGLTGITVVPAIVLYC